MYFEGNTYRLVTTQYDYGVPVTFKAGVEQGFLRDDIIIFAFQNEIIPNKEFTVDSDDYEIELSLSEDEAKKLVNYAIGPEGCEKVYYSAGRRRAGESDETLFTSYITVKGSVTWQS